MPDLAIISSQVLNLALTHDTPEKLFDLSESLQADMINVPTAHKLVVRDVLRSRENSTRCDVMGETYTVAQKSVDVDSSPDIELQSWSSIDAIISRQQFYQAISDWLFARMLTDKKNLVEDLTVLQHLKWPSYVPPEYGVVELKRVCAKLLVQYCATING